MKFVVSRDPLLRSRLLLPSIFKKALPCPVKGRATTYHFWARNALFHGLEVLGLKSGDKVLVPAFHCETVVEPILHYGCEVVFYNVNRDGIIDFEDISRRVDRHTKAIVAIHYFGILQPLQKLREFCHQYQLFLIEDCAHILMGNIGGKPIGSVGDVSIFSWRKFLPIYDGGLLVCNNVQCQPNLCWKKLDGWFQVKIIKNLFEKCLYDMSRRMTPVELRHDSREPTTQSSQCQEVSCDQIQAKTHVAEFDSSQLSWPMSRWSQSILRKINLAEIVQKRKENSNVLCKAMGQLSEVYPWSSAGADGVCAWAFPIVVPNRKDVHIKLREKGIQAFSWEGVIHPTLPIEKFPEAKFLYEHLVLLPNQQSLTQHEINLVIRGVKEILERQLPHPPEVLQ